MLRRFGGLIVVAVIALGGLLWQALDDSKPVEDLVIGDCINEPDGTTITSVETVACDETHDYEVFAVIRLPDAPGAPYPGDEATYFASLEQCFPYFSGFIGADYFESDFDINPIYPSPESWNEDDDREATCLVADYTFDGELRPVKGSVRDIGR